MAKKILALAPHPDDVEFGLGGTLSKLLSAGDDVLYVAFSPCNKSLPDSFQENYLYNELSASAKILGLKEEKLRKLDFEVREFPRDRQKILEYLIKVNREFSPDLVFLPSTDDIHQDHQVISQEGIRAFKHSSILGYELPWNNLKTSLNYFSVISEQNIETKINSIAAYKTQQKRIYSNPEFVKNLAYLRGVQAGVPLAEAFELIRWIE